MRKMLTIFFSGLYYLVIRQWISVKIQREYLWLSPSHTQACVHTLACSCLRRRGRGCRTAWQLCFMASAKHTRLFFFTSTHAQLSPVKWLNPLMNFYVTYYGNYTITWKNFYVTSNSSTTKWKHFDRRLQENTWTWESWYTASKWLLK